MLRIRISGNMLNSPHYDRTREQQKKIRAHNVENRNNSSANNENVNYVGLMDLERLKLSFEKKIEKKLCVIPLSVFLFDGNYLILVRFNHQFHFAKY